jgi:hypothetical protein
VGASDNGRKKFLVGMVIDCNNTCETVQSIVQGSG